MKTLRIVLAVMLLLFFGTAYSQQQVVKCHSGGTQPTIQDCQRQDAQRQQAQNLFQQQVVQCHSGGTQPTIQDCQRQDAQRQQAQRPPQQQVVQCKSGGTQLTVEACVRQDAEIAQRNRNFQAQQPKQSQRINCHSGGTQPTVEECVRQDAAMAQSNQGQSQQSVNSSNPDRLNQTIQQARNLVAKRDIASAKALINSLPENQRGFASEAVFGSVTPVDLTVPVLSTAVPALRPFSNSGKSLTSAEIAQSLRNILIKEGKYIGNVVRSAGEEVRTVGKVEYQSIRSALMKLNPIKVKNNSYNGDWYQLLDGSAFGIRNSVENGETIDIAAQGFLKGFKIHQQ